VCIEANPDNAAVAREVVDYAGVGEKVVILNGLGSEKLQNAAQLIAAAAEGGASSSSSGRGSTGGDPVLAALKREAAEKESAAAAAAAACSESLEGVTAAGQQAWASGSARVDYLFLDHW